VCARGTLPAITRAVVESIIARRGSISLRFPVASFVVRVPTHRVYEVVCAADPRLLHATYARYRSPANFFASGLLRTARGEATYLVPEARLAQLAGASKLFYALASFGGTDRRDLRVSPDLRKLPFITIAPDLRTRTPRSPRFGGAPALQWGRELAADTAPSERQVVQLERRHAGEGLSRMMPGSGEDRHEVTIPDGLRFSRWEIETTDSPPGSGYEVTAPSRGATGRQTVRVRWHYLPAGAFGYRLRVYASPDGRSPEQTVAVDSPGWDARAKDLFAQGHPTTLVLQGEKARQLAEAILQEGQRRGVPIPPPQPPPGGPVAEASELATASVIAIVICVGVLGLAVVGALCFAIGLVVVAFVIKSAMDNGYEVIDSDYAFGDSQHGPMPLPGGGGMSGAGDMGGAQNHQLGFKLRKRQPAE
jgi:hypothetical protein